MSCKEWVQGQLRVQILSETLIRVEKKGPAGFEDRVTFSVVERNWPGAEVAAQKAGDSLQINGAHWSVRLPDTADSLSSVVISDEAGELGCLDAERVRFSYLPAPSEQIRWWVMPDAPRMVPPEWGATPPPDAALKNSGWDIANNSSDVYVFLPGSGGYRRLVQDYIKLTGAVPLPPLYAFGLMHSRYHAYSHETALAVIDKYRQRHIPLDVFVLDTDWRVGASHGYEIDTDLFPDMKAFLTEAHARNVRVMFNDHPEPACEDALDPAELQYRWKGLTGLMKMGMDLWWYDRNWKVHLKSPHADLDRDVWGMRVYHDITERFYGDRRPLMMSNVSTLYHGQRTDPPHPIEHRYPIWWTGDTNGTWNFLRWGIANAVDFGVLAVMPYLNEDLGGHHGGTSPELYTRFLQFGCLSPGTRLHCSKAFIRDPWEFGAEAEEIVTDYVKLRYRLLPHIYTAARRAYEDGTPLLRRCDLEWPQHSAAMDSSQYLFGDDLLVAPVDTGSNDWRMIGRHEVSTSDGRPGWLAEYYDGAELTGALLHKQTVRIIDCWRWGPTTPRDLPESYSARWSGVFSVPETGGYSFRAVAKGGMRFCIDDEVVADKWDYSGEEKSQIEYDIEWTAGEEHRIKVEYCNPAGKDGCTLVCKLPSSDSGFAERNIWIPPGVWSDLWSGADVSGPCLLRTKSDLRHTPLYVRRGAIVVTVPQLERTDDYPWNAFTVDCWVPDADAVTKRCIYEDDTISTAYKKDECRNTPLLFRREKGELALLILPAKGAFEGAPARRDWTLRIHLPADAVLEKLMLNGAPVDGQLLVPENSKAMPFDRAPEGTQGGNIVQVVLTDIDASTEIALTATI